MSALATDRRSPARSSDDTGSSNQVTPSSPSWRATRMACFAGVGAVGIDEELRHIPGHVPDQVDPGQISGRIAWPHDSPILILMPGEPAPRPTPRPDRYGDSVLGVVGEPPDFRRRAPRPRRDPRDRSGQGEHPGLEVPEGDVHVRGWPPDHAGMAQIAAGPLHGRPWRSAMSKDLTPSDDIGENLSSITLWPRPGCCRSSPAPSGHRPGSAPYGRSPTRRASRRLRSGRWATCRPRR